MIYYDEWLVLIDSCFDCLWDNGLLIHSYQLTLSFRCDILNRYINADRFRWYECRISQDLCYVLFDFKNIVLTRFIYYDHYCQYVNNLERIIDIALASLEEERNG